MADLTIHELQNEATSPAANDYMVLDGATAGTRKITLANLTTFIHNKWAAFINALTAKTSFASGDKIPVVNGSTATAMDKDSLLEQTAQNSLAGNVAPAFDPAKPNGFDGYAYHKGEKVVYKGAVYSFISNKTTGAWDSNYVNRVGIYELLRYFKTAGQNIDYAIADKNGFALSLFKNGHIQTKNFDSSNLSKEIPVADFVIADKNRNAIVVFEDGHIKTKNFDSKKGFHKENAPVADFVIADEYLNAIVVFEDGHIKTKNFDSSQIATEWNINFTGKKFCFIGDSITDESVYTSYVSLLAERTGATCVNLGQSGDSIGGRAGAQYGHFKDRATAANLQGADLVCVFGGTNDFDRATYPIGPLFKEIQNTPWQYSTGVEYGVPDNTGAFGGAVHELILTIRQNCPSTPIMFITPLNRGEYSDNRPTSKEQNEHGDTMQDFRHAIEVICNFYAIPVFKAHQNPQFDFTDAATAAMYSRDNLHPNLLGQTILERQLEKWIYLNINL